MKMEYEPSLIEEVVFKEITMREEKGDNTLSEEYHLKVDPIYEQFSLEDRQKEFKKIEWDFFEKLGFSKYVEEIFSEFPEVENLISGGVVVKARSHHDECIDLVRGLDDKADKYRIKIKLLSERFHNIPYLQKLMRHEIMHVLDMLDASFGYKNEFLGGSPLEQNIIRERYSTFWDIFVDSRLLRSGKETIGSKDARFEEFAALYSTFSGEVKKAIFDKLWEDEGLTHSRMMELAKDVNKVIEVADASDNSDFKEQNKVHIPGTVCPLCHFRTYNWIENLEEDPLLVKAVKEEFPDWSPQDSACERCVEMYKSRRALSNQMT